MSVKKFRTFINKANDLNKAVKPQQAVILMTGCIEESIEQQARNEGAVAILREPLDRDEVVRVIRSLVAISSLQ